MSHKTLSLSESDEFQFPAIRRGYNSQESGFIHKVKTTKRNNRAIYFPELRRPFTEQKLNTNGSLSKSKSKSLDSLNYSRKKSNIVGSKLELEDENTGKFLLQSVPDLPVTFEERDLTRKGQHFNISHPKPMHKEIASRREKTYLDVCSQYKTDENYQSKCNNTTLPKLSQSRVSQLHRAKANLPSTHTVRMTKLPVIEQNPMNRSTLAHKWKTDCKCLRCCIMLQQFTDKDMQAYEMWGSYPCQNLQLYATTTATTSSVKHDS